MERVSLYEQVNAILIYHQLSTNIGTPKTMIPVVDGLKA
jgi:hypothetical protein